MRPRFSRFLSAANAFPSGESFQQREHSGSVRALMTLRPH
jgi:hypothetical protein